MLLGALLLCLGSCRSAVPELQNEPWRITRQGSVGLTGDLGVASGYEVESTVGIVDANFGEPSRVDGDLEGKFGGRLGAEYFALDDLSLFAGAETRVFEPDIGEDLIQFGDITTYELCLGTRWFLPVRLLESGRLRPFLHGKLAWIPKVEYDMTTRLPFDEPLEDAVMVAPYSGSSYWTAGAGGGLAYQATDHLYAHLSFFYEWPLGETSGRSTSELVQSTGNDFVDDILDGLQYDTTMKPEGWIAFLGVSYVF